MEKRVLDVGNCGPDHQAVCALVEGHFDARVVQAHDAQDTLRALQSGHFDLVLVNRKLDVDYSDGLDIIKQIKKEVRWADLPVMLVTNFREHQLQAVAAGAVYGFGKQSLREAATIEKLSSFLGPARG